MGGFDTTLIGSTAIPSAFPIISTLLAIFPKLDLDAGGTSEHTWADIAALFGRKVKRADGKTISIIGTRDLLRDGTFPFDMLLDAQLLELPSVLPSVLEHSTATNSPPQQLPEAKTTQSMVEVKEMLVVDIKSDHNGWALSCDGGCVSDLGSLKWEIRRSQIKLYCIAEIALNCGLVGFSQPVLWNNDMEVRGRDPELKDEIAWDVDSVNTVLEHINQETLDPRQYRWIRTRWPKMFRKLGVRLELANFERGGSYASEEAQCELIWYVASKVYVIGLFSSALEGKVIIVCGKDRHACWSMFGTFMHHDAATSTEHTLLQVDEGPMYQGDRVYRGHADKRVRLGIVAEIGACVALTYATSTSIMLLAYITRHTIGSRIANRQGTGKDPSLFLESSEMAILSDVRDAWFLTLRPARFRRWIPYTAIIALLLCIILRATQLSLNSLAVAPGLGDASSAGLLKGTSRFQLTISTAVFVVAVNILTMLPRQLRKSSIVLMFGSLVAIALWVLEVTGIIPWAVGNGASDLVLIAMGLYCEVRMQGRHEKSLLHPDHVVLAASVAHLVLYGQWM
ncbi:hypothetical protein HDV00_000005 [Rhizophlyctis rosea]|nr:hypothetical protein HDV00_000005 [Rhizophlyctis rosea]